MTRIAAAALLATLSLAFVDAAPLEERSSAVCLAVDVVVDILRAYPSASPFCSSLLGIPTITTTQTVSTTASFTSPISTTIPMTVTTFTSTVAPITVYSTSGTAITTCIPSAVNDKRALRVARGGKGPSTTLTSSSSVKTTSTSSSSFATSKSSSTSAWVSISNNCPGCPNVLNNIACSAVSTACSCLSIATPTSTVTVTRTLSTTTYPTTTIYSSVDATVTITGTTTIPITSTSTVNYCPTPSSCSNEGIRWGYYPNNEYNSDTDYSDYDPTVIKTETPDYQSTASVCGGIDDSDSTDISIYGSSETFSSNYFTLNHVGYLFAEVDGTYTFSFSGVDDIALLWLGNYAYSGWTRDNAHLSAVYGVDREATTTYTLEAEEYLAFRIVFGQAQGAAVFQFSVTAPDGTVILDSSTEDSPYLIQYSCDGTTAPAFPAFGSET